MLDGRLAVITGAASGIGREIAGVFAAANASVVVMDCVPDPAPDLLEELRERGAAAASFVAVDVSNTDQVAAAFAEVASRHDRLDILVNSAGVRDISDPLTLDPAEWSKVLAVDLSGTFYCCQAAARVMVDRKMGGSIINVASVAGLVGITRRVAYTAAKHGVVGLTKVLAKDLAQHKVRVNALCPGLIRTALTESYFGDERFAKSVAGFVPLGTYGEPSDVAQAALFFASDMSSYVTGTALPIDGGWVAEKTYTLSKDADAFHGTDR